jgi:alpha-beta hydrolase superfamily lysophospholipase
MAAMASLVQDVWLGWEPRLRARRLAPWEEPPARVLFQLDPGATLDDGPIRAFLESLADRLEVLAWEPRGRGASAGRFGPEVLEDARRFVTDGAGRWGALPLVLGGHGLGAWLALALADAPGVAGAFGLAPSLAAASPAATEPSPLRTALVAALARPALAVPTLVVEGRDRTAGEAEAVAQWLAREPRASRLEAAGGDAVVLDPPWPAMVSAWAEAAGRAARGPAA